MHRLRGFTLIELMIVVAIIGILAAIGISNFRTFQTRSKITEARGNLRAIATAENAYFGELGVYYAAAPTPPGVPAGARQQWVAGGVADYQVIGYEPEGAMFFQYAVDVDAPRAAFTAAAISDLDGDGVFSDFGYVHPQEGAVLGVASSVALGCTGAGVFDPGSGNSMFDVVGPCAPADGRTEY